MLNELAGASSAGVPAIIAEAGEQAVEQYRVFFDQVLKSPATRRNYRSTIRRFLRWAEQRGLTLASITAIDAEAYIALVCPVATASGTAAVYLAAIRSLFRHLAQTGILAANPLDTPLSRSIADGIRRLRPRSSLTELKETIRELDGWEDDSEWFQAGLVMLAPFSIGTREPKAVSRFTGVPLPLVREFTGRLTDDGVYLPNGKIAGEWDDPETGGVALILDIGVAVGCFERCDSAEGDIDRHGSGNQAPASATTEEPDDA